MSTVKAFLDRLMPRIPSGWSRSTGNRSVIKIIEMAQDELLEVGGDKQLFIPHTISGTQVANDGFPPYLITEEDVHRYEITGSVLSSTAIYKKINGTNYEVAADVVTRIFIDAGSISQFSAFIPWLQTPWSYYTSNPFANSSERVLISEVSVATSPRVNDTPPVVEFPFDPGDTTEVFFCEFSWRAPRLTSESIPLVVKQRFESAIEDYVMGHIHESENGKPSELKARFYEFWKNEYIADVNKGASLTTDKVRTRTC